MKETNQVFKTFNSIVKTRRSTRKFTTAIPSTEEMEDILQSAILAPFGGATGIPMKEIRTIRVFSQNTEQMSHARDLLYAQIGRRGRIMRNVLMLFPFLKKRLQSFANRLSRLSEDGIPGMTEGAYYIIVAEKIGFPPVAKQSISHVMQNMWLSATSHNLGFQLISATGMMSKNKDFMQLLGLKAGDYAIDGCIIGVPKTIPQPHVGRQIEDYVTWV